MEASTAVLKIDFVIKFSQYVCYERATRRQPTHRQRACNLQLAAAEYSDQLAMGFGELMAMGFGERAVQACLRETSGDADAALELLLSRT